MMIFSKLATPKMDGLLKMMNMGWFGMPPLEETTIFIHISFHHFGASQNTKVQTFEVFCSYDQLPPAQLHRIWTNHIGVSMVLPSHPFAWWFLSQYGTPVESKPVGYTPVLDKRIWFLPRRHLSASQVYMFSTGCSTETHHGWEQMAEIFQNHCMNLASNPWLRVLTSHVGSIKPKVTTQQKSVIASLNRKPVVWGACHLWTTEKIEYLQLNRPTGAKDPKEFPSQQGPLTMDRNQPTCRAICCIYQAEVLWSAWVQWGAWLSSQCNM